MLRVYRRFTGVPPVLAGWLLSGVWMPAAIAQPPVPTPQMRVYFTPSYALQRLSRDFNSPTNADDFFRVGREQFEQEIQRLADPRSRLTEGILKVSPILRLSQDSFLPEEPNKIDRAIDNPVN
ncbi:hypothetical protein [Leptodesmis sp.]|uniref:hypothetical protein n=1 Tax=Leptodesmis sp. TaxID=3100501 RepID=UPI004053561C